MTDPPRLKPILKAPPPSSFIGTRTTAPRKKSDCSQLSDTTTLVGSNRGSTVESTTDKKPIQSLQKIKQRFLPKEHSEPWEKYGTASKTHTLPSTDYEDMMEQLNVSYAQTAALKFETMSFVDADKLIGVRVTLYLLEHPQQQLTIHT